MKEYQDHEFCNDILCDAISSHNQCICKEIYWKDCIHTAKEFHKWLKDMGYKIIKDAPTGDQIDFFLSRIKSLESVLADKDALIKSLNEHINDKALF